MSKNPIDILVEQILLERDLTNSIFPSISDKLPDNPTEDEDYANWKKLGVPKTIEKYRTNVEKLAAADKKLDTLTSDDIEVVVKNYLPYFRDGKIKSGRVSASLSAVQKIIKSGANDHKAAVRDIIQKVLLGLDGVPEGEEAALTAKIISSIAELPEERVSIGSQDMPMASLETTEGDFEENKNLAKASPSLVNLFSSIDGESVVEKLNSIMEFSKAAEEKSLSTWAKDKNQFKVFTYSKVLARFADEIKTIGAKEAGSAFERWLGLLLNMPVVGAEGGSADNLGKTSGGTVYTSAKLFASLNGPHPPSQSESGLMKATANGTVVYYFIGLKKYDTPSKKVAGFHYITSVDLYLIKTFQEDSILKGQFINKSGQVSSQPWDLSYKPNDKNQRAIPPQGSVSLEGLQFETIYLPGGEITDNQLQSTAEFLTTAMKGLVDSPVTQAIVEAALSIKRLEADADSYASKSSNEKGTGTSYINKITDNYLALKPLYNQIFKYGEDDEQDRLQESHSSFDQLIEEVIKQNLLK